MFENIQSGDHIAHLFGSESERVNAAKLFFDHGKSLGMQCVYLCSEAETLNASESFPGVDLSIREKTYLRTGSFSPNEVYGYLKQACDDAKKSGFTGLYLAGDMRWALADGVSLEDLCRYESGLNEIFPELPCLAMCQYDRHGFPPNILSTILKVHHTILDGIDLLENVCFVNHDKFLSPEILDFIDVDGILKSSKECKKTAKPATHSEVEACFHVPNGLGGPAATFTELFECSPHMHALLDPSGNIVMANRALRDFVSPEASPGKLIGHRFMDLFQPGNDTPSKTKKKGVAKDSNGTAGPVIVSKGKADSEFEGILKDSAGREIIAAVSISPVSTRSKPFVKGAVAIIRDVTAFRLTEISFNIRKQISERLSRSRDLSAGLEAVMDTILRATGIESGCITIWAGAAYNSQIRGFDSGHYAACLRDRPGKPLFYCPDCRDEIDNCRECSAVCNATVSISCMEGQIGELRVWDRRPGFLSGEKRAFLEDLGISIGLAVERILYAENLRAVEKLSLTGRLAAGVAHDLMNPLQAIGICMELVESALQDDFSQMESFRQIGMGLSRIRETISDFLDLHKTIDRPPVLLDFNEIIRQASKFVAPSMKKSNIKVCLDLHHGSIQIKAVEKEIFFVLSNLFANARDSISAMRKNLSNSDEADAAIETSCRRSAPGESTTPCRDFNSLARSCRGTIRVSTRIDGNGTALLDFSDDGAGFPKDVQARVFEPFFTTKQALGGSGLGLSTSKEIVSKFGGTMSIVHDAHIHGATFRIALPISDMKRDDS